MSIMKNNYLKKILSNSVKLFLIMTVVLLYSGNAFASDKTVNEEQIETACKEALTVIQPMNEEKLDVNIGDIYNVVDTEGELEGYSLGYFVGDQPYGYAIYSIEDFSVREFMFCPDIENLYKELENKAEEDKEVNEDKLINGIVYEGGIDYCTYDQEGKKVNYDDRVQNSWDNKSICAQQANSILDSEYVAPESRVGDPGGLISRLGYWDVYDSNLYRRWNIVPDSGLTMIPYESSIKKINRYACTIHSVTGLLNWLGYSNVWNNYIDLWNNVYTSNGNITEDPETHTLFGGYFLDHAANYINSSYFLNSSTRAYMDKSVEFNDIVDSIDGSMLHGEKVPFSMSIWLKQIDKNGNYVYKSDGSIDEWAHTVTGVSYMQTSEKNYVGIFNGWYLYDSDNKINDDTGLKDNIDNSTSYLSVRYIDFNDLKCRENVNIEAMFLKNVSSRNIKEAKVESMSGSAIELSCYVPNGTKYVYFPTWTDSNGQDDVIWHQGTIDAWNHAVCTIDLNTHNKESSIYITHIYAYDQNHNMLAFYGSIFCDINTNIRNVQVTNNQISGYSVNCVLPTGTAYVGFPTWSAVNGQDDLIWYEVPANNGRGKITIDVSNHNNDGGLYYTDIYAYDDKRRLISTYKTIEVKIANCPKITSAEVSEKYADRYTVTCIVPTGTSSVKFPTWTVANGQDDLIWYPGTMKGDKASITVYRKDHNKELGLYYTDIYAYDLKGRIIDSSRVTVSFFK